MAINVPIISEFDKKGIDKAVAEFKRMEGPAKKAGFALEKAFLPATAALGALTVAAVDFAKAAADDQQSAAKLAGQLKRTTDATDDQVASVEKMIGALELATNIADNDLRDSLGRLSTVTKDTATAQDLLTLAVDISAATGKDLSAVTEGLAKAYGGNLTALQKLDPSLRDAIRSGASFDEVGRALTETFGGAAVDAANTAEGQFKNLGVRLGNVQEQIGYLILPIADALLPLMSSLIDIVANNSTTFTILAGIVGAVAAAVVTLNVALKAYRAIKVAVTAATAAFNAVMALNPVVLVTAAVVALIAILIVLQRRFNIVGKAVEFLGSLFSKVKDAVLAAWETLLQWFRNLGGWIVDAFKLYVEILTYPYIKAYEIILGTFGALLDFIRNIPGLIRKAVSTVYNILVEPFLNVVSAMFNIGRDIVAKIVDGIKSVASSIGSAITSAIPGGNIIGGAVGKIRGILPFADGGLVTGPTVGLIGEAGPEVVIPLDKLGKFSGGSTQTININVMSADPQAVVEAIRRYNRTNGPAPIRIAS